MGSKGMDGISVSCKPIEVNERRCEGNEPMGLGGDGCVMMVPKGRRDKVWYVPKVCQGRSGQEEWSSDG